MSSALSICIEHYGEFTVNQTVEAPLKRLEDAWAERKKELLAQPEDKRDKNAYFWTLICDSYIISTFYSLVYF